MESRVKEEFFEGMKTFTREIFNITQWTIVTVAIAWAAGALKSILLVYVYYFLGLLVTTYCTSCLFTLLGYYFPTIKPDAAPSRLKTLVSYLILVSGCALLPLGEALVNDLMRIEQIKAPVAPAPIEAKPAHLNDAGPSR